MGLRHVNKLGKNLALEAKGKYALVTIEPSYDDERKLPQRRYELHTRKGDHAATMTAQPLPGCCGVCVFHSFSGSTQGIKDFIEIGQRAAKRSGFGMVLFTLRQESVILDQIPVQRDGVAGVRHSFMNGKTGNMITLAAINTGAEPPRRNDAAGE